MRTGEPLSEAIVSIDPQQHDTGRLYIGMFTENDGKFSFDNIIDPFVTLKISHNKEYVKYKNVETNRDNVEFVFKAPDSDEPPNPPSEKTQQNQSSVPASSVDKICDYYPLITGAEWNLDGIGTTPTITYKILGTEKIEDITYFKIESILTGKNSGANNTFYARCENNCVYWLEPPNKEQLIFDFNTGANQRWHKSYQLEDSTRKTRTGRVIDTNITIEVPAGIFEKCLVYEITDTTQKADERLKSVIYTFWLAPEIGIVKITSNIGANSLMPVDLWINNLSTYSIPDVRDEHNMNESINIDDGARTRTESSLAEISSNQVIQTYINLYNSAQDEKNKLNYLMNIIELTMKYEQWDDMLKYANELLESKGETDENTEKKEALYKEKTYYLLGNAFEIQGNQNEDELLENPASAPGTQQYYKKAIEYWTKGYEQFPNSTYSDDMLFNIGKLYFMKMVTTENARELAAEYFEEYIEKYPDNPNAETAHFYQGFCFYNSRYFKEAINSFRDFSQKYIQSEHRPDALFYYADCLYNIGNLTGSIRVFDNYIEEYPEHEKVPEAYYTKAWAYLDLEREDEAIATFQLLVDKFPESEFVSTSLFSIADYYYNIQDYQNAIVYYEKVLADYPDTEVAERVPDTLKDLTETVAYLEFEKGWNLLNQAQETKDINLYRQAAEVFKTVYERYPNTEIATGARPLYNTIIEFLKKFQGENQLPDFKIQPNPPDKPQQYREYIPESNVAETDSIVNPNNEMNLWLEAIDEYEKAREILNKFHGENQLPDLKIQPNPPDKPQQKQEYIPESNVAEMDSIVNSNKNKKQLIILDNEKNKGIGPDELYLIHPPL
ncbi:tetratricopeptide repeat protein [Candidatus Latescibacterota bacterium]